MSTTNVAYRVEMRDLDGLPGTWTNVTADVVQDRKLRWTRGQMMNGPTDRTAYEGLLELWMNNSAKSTGGVQGYYAVNNANCRSGFGYGTPVRIIASLDSVDYPQWQGWLKIIDPVAGKYRDQVTHCFARDFMGVLAATQIRSIAPQVAKTEVQLLQAAIAAMPIASQPLATSYDAATDTLPYAFHNFGGGAVQAMTLVDAAVQSVGGSAYVKGDGTFTYENRHTRALRTSQATFNDTMHGLSVPVMLDNVFNRIHAQIQPPRVDAASTTEVAKTLSRVEVPGLQTVRVLLDYQDPTNTLRLIGATAFVDGTGAAITPGVQTALVASDLSGNAASDGSGADLSAFVTAQVTCYAFNAEFLITNSGTQTLWATARVRGKGIYDDTQQTFESYVAQSYGDQLLEVDLKYQTDGTIAQAYAEYLKNLASSLKKQGSSMTIIGKASAALMLQGVSRELGDAITIVETMSGINAGFYIVGLTGEVAAGEQPTYTWTVAPAAVGQVFIFDDAVYGVFDSSRLGWA